MSAGDDVGEIDLTLVVVRAQGRQGVAQVRGVEDVDAGVDLAHRPLLGRGVAVLDDPGDRERVRPARADDATVAGGVVQLGGEQGDGVAPLAVLGDERLQGGRVQQGHVPAGDDDGAGQLGGQGGQGAGHGAAGPGDLVLVGGHGVGGDLGQVGDDGGALVADHDDQVLGAQAPRGRHRVVQEAAPADAVEHLRGGRTHPGSLACGHDDDGGGGRGSHKSSSR